jgi:hypothetical protein
MEGGDGAMEGGDGATEGGDGAMEARIDDGRVGVLDGGVP